MTICPPIARIWPSQQRCCDSPAAMLREIYASIARRAPSRRTDARSFGWQTQLRSRSVKPIIIPLTVASRRRQHARRPQCRCMAPRSGCDARCSREDILSPSNPGHTLLAARIALTSGGVIAAVRFAWLRTQPRGVIGSRSLRIASMRAAVIAAALASAFAISVPDTHREVAHAYGVELVTFDRAAGPANTEQAVAAAATGPHVGNEHAPAMMPESAAAPTTDDARASG